MKQFMKCATTHPIMALIFFLGLTGCATSQAPAEKTTTQANRFSSSNSSSPNNSDPGAASGPTASISMRSTGMPMGVLYSLSSESVDCKGFENIGTVVDKAGARKVLLPWIAKMTNAADRRPEELLRKVPAGNPIQVRSYGSWFDTSSRGSCGPTYQKFSPVGGRQYLVEFVWGGTTSCSTRITDITTGQAQAVPAEALTCP